MRYARKPLTATPSRKIRNLRSYLKNGTKYGNKIDYKVVQNHLFITKKLLAHKNDTNEKHKTHMCLIELNKSALAGNEAHLSVMLKMVSFSNNTHLDTGLHFPLHILQHGRRHADTSIRNTVSKFLHNIGGHSTANPLENRILRPSFSGFFRVMSRYNFGSCEPNKYAFKAFYF
ncbi:hypothetical protein AVEN_244718-1 [Araneus ventricosus]|uniref:Uncharacterized protein n=1 Tax=Araneus ventricosus TaxID=182803 RepID=A0A4Y2BRA2_ARAVE|nr:hypothetical protein AVEN_244718-1 [Araneus ventricosus]